MKAIEIINDRKLSMRGRKDSGQKIVKMALINQGDKSFLIKKLAKLLLRDKRLFQNYSCVFVSNLKTQLVVNVVLLICDI